MQVSERKPFVCVNFFTEMNILVRTSPLYHVFEFTAHLVERKMDTFTSSFSGLCFITFFSGLPVEAEPVAPHQLSKGASLDTGTDYLGFCFGTILLESCCSNLLIILVVWYIVLGLRLLKAGLKQRLSVSLMWVF